MNNLNRLLAVTSDVADLYEFLISITDSTSIVDSELSEQLDKALKMCGGIRSKIVSIVTDMSENKTNYHPNAFMTDSDFEKLKEDLLN